MLKLLTHLQHELECGNDVVLVTIIASSGSTPRGSGARMLVGKSGLLYGTIGGGAVEYRAQHLAEQSLADKSSAIQRFELNKKDIAALGMVCGGAVMLYLQYIPAGDRHTIVLCQKASEVLNTNQRLWFITDISEDRNGQIGFYNDNTGFINIDNPPSPQQIKTAKYREQQTIEGRTYFIEHLEKGSRVLIFGGGHVARQLVPVLAPLGFSCVVMDDRPEFSTREHFMQADEVLTVDFTQISNFVTISGDDYVVVMTRGHQFDTIIQAQVLHTPARYIGVIGSAAKKHSVNAQLREMGHSEESISRIKTPIGLPIKAETPEEIAISIAGELIMTRAESSSNHSAVPPAKTDR